MPSLEERKQLVSKSCRLRSFSRLTYHHGHHQSRALLSLPSPSTAIDWNDTARTANGTFYCTPVAVSGANFIANNISFMNLAPIAQPGEVNAQAVAIRVAGDQAAFWGCRFFGGQDTLHGDKGRHSFKECFIQGSIDFIFGNGWSLYENCAIIIASEGWNDFYLAHREQTVFFGEHRCSGPAATYGQKLNDTNFSLPQHFLH